MGDGQKVVTRDLLTVKIWDMCNNREPLLSIPVDEHIKRHLPDLFEAELLDDQFSMTEANRSVVTGNYGNSFHIIDPETGANMHYELG